MEGLKEYTKEELQEYSKEELIEGVIDAIGIINELDQRLEKYREGFKYQKRCKKFYGAIIDYAKDNTERIPNKNGRAPKPEDFGLKADEDGILHLIEGSRD